MVDKGVNVKGAEMLNDAKENYELNTNKNRNENKNKTSNKIVELIKYYLEELKYKILDVKFIDNIIVVTAFALIIAMITGISSYADTSSEIEKDVVVTTALKSFELENKPKPKDKDKLDINAGESNSANSNDTKTDSSIKLAEEKNTVTNIAKISSDIKTYEIININTSDKEKLTNLPGVGEKMAEKIIEYRESNGNFKSKDELLNVSGIGDKKYDKMKKYVEV